MRALRRIHRIAAVVGLLIDAVGGPRLERRGPSRFPSLLSWAAVVSRANCKRRVSTSTASSSSTPRAGARRSFWRRAKGNTATSLSTSMTRAAATPLAPRAIRPGTRPSSEPAPPALMSGSIFRSPRRGRRPSTASPLRSITTMSRPRRRRMDSRLEGVMQFRFCSALVHEAGEDGKACKGFRTSLSIFDEPPPSAPLCAPPHVNSERALRTRLPQSSGAADHGRIVGHGAPDLGRTRLASRSHPILLMQSITRAPNTFLRSAK